MPKNEKQDIQAEGAETTLPAETKMERFEREQLSRRAALKKMGLTTGMALFAMFSVDDLARMVGQAMERRAGDSKIADQIAREFQQAGIVLASGPSGMYPPGKNCTCNNNCGGLCECECTFDQCVTDRQLCAQYPACCDANCQPLGNLSGACTEYSLAIQAAAKNQANCLQNPSAFGHKGCDSGF